MNYNIIIHHKCTDKVRSLKPVHFTRWSRIRYSKSSSCRIIKLSSSIALCMLELYHWTLEGRPWCRGVRGVCIATCETCSLLPGRIHMLCLRWNIPTSSFVLCYKCIQFLVCSGISSWAKGYHAPWLDPRTGWLSLHVPSLPVFSSIRWLGQLLLGSELVEHL